MAKKTKKKETKETVLEKINLLSETDKEWIVDKLNPLICEECDEEIIECEQCGAKFDDDIDIICDNEYHFCTDECAKDFYYNEKCPAEGMTRKKYRSE